MRRRTHAAIRMIALLSMLCTGCWDRVEINERGFVIGVAIDKPDADQAEKRNEEEDHSKSAPAGEANKGRVSEALTEKTAYGVTYQFVVPGAIQSNGKGGGGKASGKAFFNQTATGHTMDGISRKFASRISRRPYFEHLKMIIVSEEIASSKDGFSEVLDFYLRDHEMRRGVKVLVARDRARDVLTFEPPNEKLPVMYLNSIAENVSRNARILPETKIGDIHERLLRRESYTVQSVSFDHEEVLLAGAAVFQGGTNKLVGFLSETETVGLNFLTDEIRGGALEARGRSESFVLNIKNSKRTIKADLSDIRKPRFTIRIETEGTIGETFESVDFLDEDTVREVEAAAAQEIDRLVLGTAKKLQNEYKADVIGFGSHLSQRHYKQWKTIKDDWDTGDNLFSSSTISLETKVIIRQIGTVNKTTSQRR